jgi:hypothetical protein
MLDPHKRIDEICNVDIVEAQCRASTKVANEKGQFVIRVDPTNNSGLVRYRALGSTNAFGDNRIPKKPFFCENQINGGNVIHIWKVNALHDLRINWARPYTRLRHTTDSPDVVQRILHGPFGSVNSLAH